VISGREVFEPDRRFDLELVSLFDETGGSVVVLEGNWNRLRLGVLGEVGCW